MNNKRLLAIAASACMAMLANTAVAKGFNYTWAEAGYRNYDADSVEGDGARVGFSFGATDYIHLVGSYSRLWIDDLAGTTDADVDLDEFKIGFGGHYSITDKIDLVGQAAYVDQEFTGDARPAILGGLKTNVNNSEEGYEIDVFGRIRAMKKLEMTPHIVYLDVGEVSETGFGLGLVYKMTKKFSLRVRGTHFSDDSATNLFLGVRLKM
jgi:hypothetical protein